MTRLRPSSNVGSRAWDEGGGGGPFRIDSFPSVRKGGQRNGSAEALGRRIHWDFAGLESVPPALPRAFNPAEFCRDGAPLAIPPGRRAEPRNNVRMMACELSARRLRVAAVLKLGKRRACLI